MENWRHGSWGVGREPYLQAGTVTSGMEEGSRGTMSSYPPSAVAGSAPRGPPGSPIDLKARPGPLGCGSRRHIGTFNLGDHIGPFNLGNPGEFTMLELAQVCRQFVKKTIKCTNDNSIFPSI